MWSFVGANLAVFLSLFISKGFTVLSVDYFWHRVTAKDGILAATIPILAIVLTGVLSDRGKATLVFWRWHHPLPGCRAFTELVGTDPRIDVAALKKKIGEFPDDPQAQNALWYRMYNRHGTEQRISEAHRIYLLTRDMAAISVLFLALFPTGAIAGAINWTAVIEYAGALVVQYLLVASAARNYGNRFVLNVLAEESQT